MKQRQLNLREALRSSGAFRAVHTAAPTRALCVASAVSDWGATTRLGKSGASAVQPHLWRPPLAHFPSSALRYSPPAGHPGSVRSTAPGCCEAQRPVSAEMALCITSCAAVDAPQKHGADLQRRAPLVLQDVKADAAQLEMPQPCQPTHAARPRKACAPRIHAPCLC